MSTLFKGYMTEKVLITIKTWENLQKVEDVVNYDGGLRHAGTGAYFNVDMKQLCDKKIYVKILGEGYAEETLRMYKYHLKHSTAGYWLIADWMIVAHNRNGANS